MPAVHEVIFTADATMRAVAQKQHHAVVKFDTYRNVQRHRVVLPAIAPLL